MRDNYIKICFIFQRIIIRLWGRTIHDQPGDIAQEVVKAFSNKPCFGACNESQHVDFNYVVEHEFPTRRYVSRECSMWSVDTYENNQNFCPAMCKSCKDILPREAVHKYKVDLAESVDESQSKDVCLQEAVLKSDPDSELTDGGIGDEDFSDMHLDDENIADNPETEGSRGFKSESEGLTKISIKKERRYNKNKECPSCTYTGHNLQNLQRHYNRKHREQNKRTLTEAQKEVAVHGHPWPPLTPEQIFINEGRCPSCTFMGSKDAISNHYSRKHKEKNKKTLKEAIGKVVVHGHPWPPLIEVEKVVQEGESHIFKCPKCDYESDKKCNVSHHVKSVHEKKCSLCGHISLGGDELRDHVAGVHDYYKYSGPVAVIQNQNKDNDGELEIVSVENAEHQFEYRGSLPPFHDNRDSAESILTLKNRE